MQKQEWFERWFGDEYKALYPHRDQAQARDQVGALLRSLSASPAWLILDVGCGSGRHLRSFRESGFTRACGIDLSAVLLRDARAVKAPVARADMRHPPFADGTFDLLASFFTSFGYFASRDENLSVLGGFSRAVKPGGFVFLDLPNPEHVKQTLVPRETRTLGDRRVDVERRIEGDQVVKRIILQSGEDRETYEELVHLFSLDALTPRLKEWNLSLSRIFGDEGGAEFSPRTSPRMGLLLRRA